MGRKGMSDRIALSELQSTMSYDEEIPISLEDSNHGYQIKLQLSEVFGTEVDAKRVCDDRF